MRPARRRAPNRVINQRLAVPAYFRPGPDWRRLAAADPMVGIAVVNVDSGPGTQQIVEYGPALSAVRDAGVQVLGYLDTAHASRPIADVLADVERYRTWYGTTGYLLDQAHVACSSLDDYYGPLRDAIRRIDPNALIALNPGVPVPECFMDVADVLIDFEGSSAAYLSCTSALWRAAYEPSRFWHIVHGAPPDALRAILDAAALRNTGWMFITDQPIDGGPAGSYLYDRLPDERTWQRLSQGLSRSTRGRRFAALCVP